MVIDIDKVLSGWKTYYRNPSEVIATDERLAELADRMASRGYRHTRETLEALADWMNGYGILLTGKVGVGKSHFFHTLCPDTPVLSMREAFLWEYNEIDNWLGGCMNTDIVVDDVGAEQRSRKFGEPYWMITLVLEKRIRSGYRTNFTTNYRSEELQNKYEDASIIDRLFELAKGHAILTQDSMREAHPRRCALQKMHDTYFRP